MIHHDPRPFFIRSFISKITLSLPLTNYLFFSLSNKISSSAFLMEMGVQATRGVGEGELRFCTVVICSTKKLFIGVSCLQLSLLTMDQNVVFLLPFIIL